MIDLPPGNPAEDAADAFKAKIRRLEKGDKTEKMLDYWFNSKWNGGMGLSPAAKRRWEQVKGGPKKQSTSN